MIIFSNHLKHIKPIAPDADIYKITFLNGGEIEAQFLQMEQLNNIGKCDIYRRTDNNEKLIISNNIEMINFLGYPPEQLQSNNSAFTRRENGFISSYNSQEQEKILLNNEHENIIDIKSVKSIVPDRNFKGLYKITFADNVSINANFCLKLIDHLANERIYYFKQEGGDNMFFSIESPKSLKLEKKLVNNISQVR